MRWFGPCCKKCHGKVFFNQRKRYRQMILSLNKRKPSRLYGSWGSPKFRHYHHRKLLVLKDRELSLPETQSIVTWNNSILQKIIVRVLVANRAGNVLKTRLITRSTEVIIYKILNDLGYATKIWESAKHIRQENPKRDYMSRLQEWFSKTSKNYGFYTNISKFLLFLNFTLPPHI